MRTAQSLSVRVRAYLPPHNFDVRLLYSTYEDGAYFVYSLWVCQIDCVKGKNSSWKAIAKLNGETVEGRFPIGNRHRPLLGNILNR
ncbi:MAG TPA: hypothetical protein IGS53_04360, partial [Leptolyngbyaceae cyanobacterium M33_DOE_097]|nr:hypothetical protein [Leptolyngbyaceae cyanobacterium M33_DOE_097]